MKFSTRQDIEAPIDYVFSQISDFGAFERRGMRQGAKVTRTPDGPVTRGTQWDITFRFRGRDRAVRSTLIALEAPQMMQIDSALDGMDAILTIELIALSQTRTRILVGFDLRAKSLTARVMLQSLKLAKSKLTKRFDTRVQGYAEDIEDRYRREGV
ncbi:MAG: SRPBCC family protein [Yoonia sp.]|uniref:SRPBCC family protein n=1 Tax=Yoonia sp. TaxID=2212373 RepID=UPI003EF40940